MASATRYSVASMIAHAAMRMPLLDVAFQLMDSARSPQDFTFDPALQRCARFGWTLRGCEKRDESFSG